MRIRTRGLIIMLSQGLRQVTTIVLGVVLVRMISKQAFGTYRQVLLVYTFVAELISLQLQASLYYFIPRLGIERRRALLLQTLLITYALAVVAASVMFGGSRLIARGFGNAELVPLQGTPGTIGPRRRAPSGFVPISVHVEI